METCFEEVITSRERLREVKGPPIPRSAVKDIDRIDDICRRFIVACPFIVVATRGEDGQLSLSPKGDPAGFVAVLDEKTLAIPDRLGNGRLDTFENLLINPEIGLFFLIPGNGETLRISGKGYIVPDAELQKGLVVNGKAPELVLVINVETGEYEHGHRRWRPRHDCEAALGYGCDGQGEGDGRSPGEEEVGGARDGGRDAEAGATEAPGRERHRARVNQDGAWKRLRCESDLWRGTA